MSDVPKTKFSRRGFLKGASVTAATTVIESANALAREANSPSTPRPDVCTSRRSSARTTAAVPSTPRVSSARSTAVSCKASYALFEQRIMDRNAGYMLNANLENYKILGAREVPQIEFGTGHYSDGNTAHGLVVPFAVSLCIFRWRWRFRWRRRSARN